MNLNQLLLFLTIGSVSAIVNIGVLGIGFSLLGLDYKVAASISYLLAVITHFFGNRHFTFKSSHLSLSAQLKKYSVSLIVNYMLTLTVVTAFVELLHLSPYLGMVAAIGLGLVVNYTMSRFWIFKHHEV